MVAHPPDRNLIDHEKQNGRDGRGDKHATRGSDAHKHPVPDEGDGTCHGYQAGPEQILTGSGEHLRFVGEEAEDPVPSQNRQ